MKEDGVMNLLDCKGFFSISILEYIVSSCECLLTVGSFPKTGQQDDGC
jgi:hypothetical protein